MHVCIRGCSVQFIAHGLKTKEYGGGGGVSQKSEEAKKKLERGFNR